MTISTAAVREGEAADEYTRSTAQASSSPPRAKGGRPQGFLPLQRKLLGGFIIHGQVGEFFAGGGEGLEKFRAGFRVAIGFGVTLHFLDGAKGKKLVPLQQPTCGGSDFFCERPHGDLSLLTSAATPMKGIRASSRFKFLA
jgi:hypothetical protein